MRVVETRVTNIVLATLLDYFRREGVPIPSISRLVHRSVQMLFDILVTNGKVKPFSNEEAAKEFLDRQLKDKIISLEDIRL